MLRTRPRRGRRSRARAVAILADLQGPKIRLGRFADGPVLLRPGDSSVITIEDVPGDAKMRVDDVQGTARRREPRRPHPRRRRPDRCCEAIGVDGPRSRRAVIEGGKLSDNKGINLPGVAVSVPALSEKDIDDLRWALQPAST